MSLARTARAIKQASRQKYTDRNQWLKIAKPLRNSLREAQREALLAYLLHTLNLDNSRALYTHFLIDVEMSACMLTSRIAQAISSIQLFVQRCLMNLENVRLSPKDSEEWNWMKNYRSWEAARKTFINPENWLYPQLRDDKTPLFSATRKVVLMQGEITATTVQHKYREYLAGLDRIANLEIHATVRQWEPHHDVLHVFGRTRNIPHLYFYRRWVEQRYWTNWEPVEIAIEGNHLVPVVWEGHLYLFWPTFMEKGEVPQSPNVARQIEKVTSGDINVQLSVKRYYEIKMSWSTFINAEMVLLLKSLRNVLLRTLVQT